MADYGELLKGALVNEASDLGIWQGEGIIENLAKNGAVKYFGFTLNTATGAGSRLALTGAGAEDLSFCVYTSAGDLVGFAMDARSGVSLANLNSGDYIIKVSGSDTADFTVSHTITSAPSVSVDTADDFVVLFSGGYTASANRTYYYADIKKMYGLLTGVYGIAAENIYVLYADGTDPGIDNAAGESSDMSFAASSTVLAATENNLREVFSEISLAADGSDHFLFYSFDHGAESIDGSDYLCGWNEMISDRDFTAYADGITAGYQTWIMSQCYSWGMLEDITVSDTVFCAASSSGGKASHTAVSNVTGEVTAGFTASVAGGLESGLDSTHALFEYVLADNRYTELDNSTYAGGDFGIFGYGAAVENSTGSTGGDEDEKEIIAAKLQVLDESGAKELFEAAVNTTVAVSAKALALELGSAVRAVRFYLTGSDGVRRELEVDTESRDGWSFLWTIGKEFAPGEYTLSAVAEGSSGEYSEAVEVDFTVREENFHPEIISIALDHAAYCAQSTMTVTGKAFDLDRNGIDSVRVYLDADGDGVFPYPEEYLGLAAVGADGSWSYTFTLPETLEVGTYRIMAEAVDGFDMMVGASKALEFKVAERIVSEFQADSSRLVWLDLAAGACTVEITGKGTNGYLLIETDGSGVDLFNLNTACEVRARYSNGIWNTPVSVNESVVVNEVVPAPEKFVSVSNGALDLFFVTVAGVWGVEYEAKHVGNGVWSGTGETVDLAGKNRIRDIFEGSSDANVLVMTDDANGDALFADDIYSERPKGTEGARVENIKEVRAGAGDDIVDMTSSRYVGTGGVMTVFGGDGDDTIWAGNGSNTLFGDGGSDRIVGGADADVIAGGAGDDTLHGGGGDDIFTFGRNWGRDTVTQLAGGRVTLWFAAGDSSYWNAETLTYSSNGNTVKVLGIGADKVTLKFGSDESALYTRLLNAGAFAQSATQKIYTPNETVYTNDTLADTTIAGGYEHVYYGEYASSVTLTDWGELYIQSGGSASDITLDAGNMYIRSGASATGIEITESGGNLYISGFASEITAHNGTIDVSSYDEDDPAIVSNVELQNAHLSVGECGSAFEVTIGQNASMWVSSGGSVISASLEPYGALNLSSGATAVETTIHGGASMTIIEGAKVSKTTVNGSLFVSEGASANSVTVNSGGYIHIASGATVNKLNWTPFNGTVESAQGANVTYVALSGCYAGSDGKLVGNVGSICAEMIGVSGRYYSSGRDEYFRASYDEVYVMSRGIAEQNHIEHGGIVHVSNGGSAQWNSVELGGSLCIYEGGCAYGDWVGESGYMYIASGGTATQICEGGGYVEVAEGAVAEFASCTIENIVVSVYDSMTVHANTVVNGVTVSGQYGGEAVLDIFSGGVVNDMTLHSGGVVTIASGGTATEITENGGYIYVADGATVEFVENTFGNYSLNRSATVHKNTVAENLDVVNGGYLYIYEGGVATGIKENGGFVYVADGANVEFIENSISGIFYEDVSLHSKTTAQDITVSGATLHIFDGGVASNVKMSEDYEFLYDKHGNHVYDIYGNASCIWFAGETVVYAGGSANQVSVNSGNKLYVSSGGKATQVTENGGYVELVDGAEVEFLANTLTGYISATSATLHENTRAENVTVIGDGALYVCSGGYASNTSVGAANWGDGEGSMFVQAQGIAENIDVTRSGYLVVSSGGTATAIKENGGFVYVEDGAEVLFEKVVHSGWFEVDNMTVHSNTSVINAYISSGNLHICSGGYASNVSATRGAALHISSGGLLDKAEQFEDYDYDKQQYVGAGGIFVYEGGSANSVTLDAGDSMTVYSGGTATQLLENGGFVTVEDGAEVEFISNTLSYGYSGNMTVHSNTIMAGRLSSGTLFIYDGGIASGATISGGSMHISSGGYAKDVTLTSGSDYEQGRDTSALAVISSGGVAENTKMYGYTSMHILDGGVASNTSVDGSGTIIVSSGGTANDTDMGYYGSMTLLSGATANNVDIYSGSYGEIRLQISSGAVANDVTLANGSATVEGRVDTAFINASGRIDVLSGGEINDVVMSGSSSTNYYGNVIYSAAYMNLSNGAVANHVTIDDLGNMYIGSGGSAHDVTVNKGGTVNMYQGTATAVRENGGWVDVNGEVEFSANTFENMTITKSATVHKNTVANDIVISGSGAKMVVYDGGMTSDVIVSGGSFYISSGGSADNASVRSGLMTVFTGGTATEVILDKGTLKVSSGGTATIAYNPWLTGEVTSAEESVVTYLDRDAGVYLGSAGYFVSKADEFTDINVGANSSALVYDGGTLNTATVESGGVIHISEGGVADSTTVNMLGTLYISAGATATQITENGGFVEIAEGATATFASNTFKDLTYINQSATVHANTIAENITLSSGGWLGVYNGGTANSTTVNSRCSMHIFNGGLANSTIVKLGGSMLISTGGLANSTTISSGASMNISEGGVANSTTVNNNGSLCLIGGTANSTTIKSNGHMHISTGGVANNTTMIGGIIKISSGGAANSTTINSNGVMDVVFGGIANSTTMNYGYLNISSGGVANNTTMSGGSMTINEGGIANSTIVISLGRLHIFEGGIVNSTTIYSSGYLYISSGGVANSTTLNQGGFLKISSGGSASAIALESGAFLWISAGADVTSAMVNSAASLTVSSDGVATDIIENGGYVVIAEGATATFASNTFKDVTYTNQSATVHANTIAENISLSSDGSLHIYEGGIANSTTVNSCGFLHLSGGVANSTTVNSAGSMSIASGGIANSTTVMDGAMTILKSGSANNTTVNSGYLYISSGGTATQIVENGGYVQVYEGATVEFASHTISGLSYTNREVTVHSNTVAENITLASSGCLHIFNGGIANSTTINGNGCMHISSGGVANSTTVNSDGDMYISSGGTATQIVENGGYVQVYEGAIVEFASHTINGLIISGRSATLHSNTVAENVTLRSDGSIEIFSGGVANRTTMSACTHLYISSGGVANNTSMTYTYAPNLWGPVMSIGEGGVANDTYVCSRATLTISSGGVANGTVLANYGSMLIGLGGVANNTYAVGSGMHISSGGVANSTTLRAGASMVLYSGGVASDTFMSAGASIVFSGGIARGVELQAAARFEFGKDKYEGVAVNRDTFLITRGTEISGLEVRSLGAVYMSGGVLSGAAVEDRGILQLCSGTYAADILVGSGGHCYLGDGSVVSGEFSIAEGATVLAFTGSILNFTVGDCSADKALVNDLCAISGNLDYTITLSTEQSSGLYRLADNVDESFKQEELMLFFGEDSIEGFNVGETLNAQGVTLELSLENNSLFLEVTNPNAPALSGIPDIDGGEFHNGNNGMLA